MIVKANDVKGLPVISIDTGSRLEDVDSAIYDPDTHTVLGLVVRPKGMFSDPQVIDLRDIHEIGKDVVTVQNASVIKEAKRVSDRMYSLIQMDKHFLQNSIVTEDGEKLGKISDFYFDSHSGVVDHFEVSQGILGNAASGKKSITPADIITLGQDVTVVKTQTREVIKDQEATQGVVGKLSDLKQKTSLQMEDLMDKGDDMKKQDQQYEAPSPYTGATPHYASMHGEPSTTVDRMSFGDKVGAVTSGLKNTVQDRVDQPDMQDRKHAAQDNLQQAKDTVVDKFHQLKQAVTAKADETKTSMQDKQAADATGKFLTKTVFDPVTNSPIAERGAMVDYNVVNTARERGVLDQVVDNVTDTPVQ